MNIFYRRNYLLTSIIILMFLCFSCSEDTSISEVGDEWIESNTNVMLIDTLTVKSSSFKFDSISVSESNRLLVGSYTDEKFGFIESKVFAQFQPTTFTIDSEAELDSVALILKYDDYVYNDTLQTQTFNVYEIMEAVENDDDDFYNTTTFEIADASIGSRDFKPYPTLDDSLRVPITYAFGEEIFEKIKNKNLTNTDDFLREYRGISIVPERGNTSILGFTRESFLRLYYTVDGEVETEGEVLDLNFNSSNTFHQISADKTGNYLDSLSETSYLPSVDSENQMYIQAGIGITTRIDFPNMEALNNIPGKGTIIDAHLKIYLKHRENKLQAARDSLQFSIINQRSEIIGELYDYTESSVVGEIQEEDQEFNITSYDIPVKYFLDAKREDQNGHNWYLAMYSQDFNSSVDSYIFYGEEAEDALSMKLELTYALYDE